MSKKKSLTVRGSRSPQNTGKRLAEMWVNFRKYRPDLFDASTLGTRDPEHYLGNRLWRAFMAGAEAQERIQRATKEPGKKGRKK